jgi:hypothetical protein
MLTSRSTTNLSLDQLIHALNLLSAVEFGQGRGCLCRSWW